jgi:catechol 2,3-dioxygenase-like lactoylglutathione lyase family enzyme
MAARDLPGRYAPGSDKAVTTPSWLCRAPPSLKRRGGQHANENSNFREARRFTSLYSSNITNLEEVMITKANHFSIFVLDQTSAYDFYVNKLGFKVNTDAEMGPKGRWLTVNPPGQPDLEITLMAIDDKMMFNAESAAIMRDLVKKNTFGFAVFECDDMLATYEELKAKGVKFTKEPTKEFYGFNAVFEDDSGNWFSLSEAKKN